MKHMELFNSNGVPVGAIADTALILDISESKKMWETKNPGRQFTEALAMAYAQRAWCLSPERANRVDLILVCCKDCNASHSYREIVGVFKIGRDGNDKFIASPWDDDADRCVFLAEPADEKYQLAYLDKYLPPRQQGQANPVEYVD